MTALVLGAVLGHGHGGLDVILIVAIAVAAVLAWRGRSMTWVVLAGAATYAALALAAILR